jgi:predicted signal transduction protein with EAL and GGDEF domain
MKIMTSGHLPGNKIIRVRVAAKELKGQEAVAALGRYSVEVATDGKAEQAKQDTVPVLTSQEAVKLAGAVRNLTKAVLRETDTLVRYGVEEFLLLLPETDISGSKYVVDRLKLVMGNTPFIHNNQRIEIRFSAGVAALKAQENGRALVLRADEALYRAKHSGRGRIEIAS